MISSPSRDRLAGERRPHELEPVDPAAAPLVFGGLHAGRHRRLHRVGGGEAGRLGELCSAGPARPADAHRPLLIRTAVRCKVPRREEKGKPMNRGTAKNAARKRKNQPMRGPVSSRTASRIRFRATLLRPATAPKSAAWTFLTLPKEASAKLPSRGMVSVEAPVTA